MAQEKQGLFSRIMEGKEKNEEYARSTLPTNRWQLFWDIMKGRIGKVVIINLLVLVFFLPMIALMVFYNITLQAQGLAGPYGTNIGIGYPAIPDVTGQWEGMSLSVNTMFFGGLVFTSFIAAIGLAGGMYVIRNMLWTEGIFVANDFWKGIKHNYTEALFASVFFSLFLFITVYVWSLTNYFISIGTGNVVWFTIAKVVCVVATVLAAFMSLWMISLGVTYHQKKAALIKNAFIMTVGTLPQTVVFAVVALAPFALILTGTSFLVSLGFVFIVLIGFSYALLVWIDFSQWAFDKYINPSMKGAKVGRGLYNPNAKKSEDEGESDEASALRAYKLAIIKEGKSNLMSRPMKPIDDDLTVYNLPESFSREDLQKLSDSKKAIADSQAAYEEEHKNDSKYVEYNKQFEEREKALKPEVKKNGKLKKSKPKMLNE